MDEKRISFAHVTLSVTVCILSTIHHYLNFVYKKYSQHCYTLITGQIPNSRSQRTVALKKSCKQSRLFVVNVSILNKVDFSTKTVRSILFCSSPTSYQLYVIPAFLFSAKLSIISSLSPSPIPFSICTILKTQYTSTTQTEYHFHTDTQSARVSGSFYKSTFGRCIFLIVLSSMETIVELR